MPIFLCKIFQCNIVLFKSAAHYLVSIFKSPSILLKSVFLSFMHWFIEVHLDKIPPDQVMQDEIFCKFETIR